jgi:Domain of unknown function (DUF4915)
LSQLLISFCNTRPKGLPLARFDFSTQNLAWLETALPENEVEGATGLCRHGEGFYVLLQHKHKPGRDAALGFLDRNLEIRGTTALDTVRDAHSMIEHEGALLVASTGTNQIVRVRWDGVHAATEEVFWSAVGESTDSVHLNSILEFRGELFISLFGAKNEGSWEVARNGQVRSLTTGRVLCEGLAHPHSLFVLDDQVCCLGSLDGRVFRANGGTGQNLWNVQGYARGVARDGRHLYVASSVFRKRSRKKKAWHVIPAAPVASSSCGLYRIDLISGSIEHRDLSGFGQEVYDLAVLPPELARAFSGSREDALARRLALYDQQHLEMIAAYEENVAVRLCYDQELHRLINEDHDYQMAAQQLQRLLEQDATNGDWQYHYAYCLLHLGGAHEEAIRHFHLALNYGFNEFWIRYNLVTAHLQAADLAEAEANLSRAWELKPEGMNLEPLREQLETSQKNICLTKSL